MSPIRFRPHHFLCTLGFEGKGYSEAFVKNFAKIADHLRNTQHGDLTLIEVTSHTDDICTPCPSRRNLLCETESKIKTLDLAHAKALDIKPGDTLSWKEAKEKISKNISEDVFNQICAPCAWKPMGMCLSALKKNSQILLLIILTSCLLVTNIRSAQAKTKNQKPKTNQQLELRSLEALPLDQLIELSTTPHLKNFKIDPELRLVQKIIQNKNRSQILDLLSHFPGSAWSAHIPVWLTEVESKEALKIKTNSPQFLRATEKAFLRTPSYAYIPHVLIHKYIESCKSLNKDEVCRLWLRKLAQSYPKASQEGGWIQSVSSDIFTKNQTPSFSKINQKYPSPDLDFKLYDQGLKAFITNNLSEAILQWESLLHDYPKSSLRYRTLFWLGKSKKLGLDEFTDISAHTPLSYYGLIASLEAKTIPSRFIEAEIPTSKRRDPGLYPDEIRRLERTEKLIQAQKLALASQEIGMIKPRDSLSNDFLIYLASLQNTTTNYSQCFYTLNELFLRQAPKVFSTAVEQLIFPIPYLELIQSTSNTIDMDPILIQSLIKQESAFDSSALSSSGASGLMQLMPFTAVDVDPNLFRDELIIPSKNVMIGTKYLKSLIHKYHGNLAFAISAYNAGPVAVDRWIKEGKSDLGLLLYIEQIPFKETREYLAAIIRNYWWYHLKIKGETPETLLEYFWIKQQT